MVWIVLLQCARHPSHCCLSNGSDVHDKRIATDLRDSVKASSFMQMWDLDKQQLLTLGAGSKVTIERTCVGRSVCFQLLLNGGHLLPQSLRQLILARLNFKHERCVAAASKIADA